MEFIQWYWLYFILIIHLIIFIVLILSIYPNASSSLFNTKATLIFNSPIFIYIYIYLHWKWIQPSNIRNTLILPISKIKALDYIKCWIYNNCRYDINWMWDNKKINKLYELSPRFSLNISWKCILCGLKDLVPALSKI